MMISIFIFMPVFPSNEDIQLEKLVHDVVVGVVMPYLPSVEIFELRMLCKPWHKYVHSMMNDVDTRQWILSPGYLTPPKKDGNLERTERDRIIDDYLTFFQKSYLSTYSRADKELFRPLLRLLNKPQVYVYRRHPIESACNPNDKCYVLFNSLCNDDVHTVTENDLYKYCRKKQELGVSYTWLYLDMQECLTFVEQCFEVQADSALNPASLASKSIHLVKRRLEEIETTMVKSNLLEAHQLHNYKEQMKKNIKFFDWEALWPTFDRVGKYYNYRNHYEYYENQFGRILRHNCRAQQPGPYYKNLFERIIILGDELCPGSGRISSYIYRIYEPLGKSKEDEIKEDMQKACCIVWRARKAAEMALNRKIMAERKLATAKEKLSSERQHLNTNEKVAAARLGALKKARVAAKEKARHTQKEYDAAAGYLKSIQGRD
jgi:hypothetical protein